MPGGSGIDYLWVAALWFGGYLDSASVTVHDAPATIFQGPLVSTAMDGAWLDSNEIMPYYFEDDPSGVTLGRITETSMIEGRINCLFQDVYDPKSTAYEQFTNMYTDKYSDRTYTGFDYAIDNRMHIPLGLEIKQTSYAWPYDYAKKFIIFDFTIYNRN